MTNVIFTPFMKLCLLLKLAESSLIQVISMQLSILFCIDISHFFTHYFSFHIFLVPIQYHCIFSLLCVVPVACMSINKKLFSQINIYMLLDFQKKNQTLFNSFLLFFIPKFTLMLQYPFPIMITIYKIAPHSIGYLNISIIKGFWIENEF